MAEKYRLLLPEFRGISVSHNPLYNEQLVSGTFRGCWLTCKGQKWFVAISHFIKKTRMQINP